MLAVGGPIWNPIAPCLPTAHIEVTNEVGPFIRDVLAVGRDHLTALAYELAGLSGNESGSSSRSDRREFLRALCRADAIPLQFASSLTSVRTRCLITEKFSVWIRVRERLRHAGRVTEHCDARPACANNRASVVRPLRQDGITHVAPIQQLTSPFESNQQIGKRRIVELTNR